MYDKKYLYEFDPSGGLAANRVPDELHIINPASGSDYDVIIPNFAPFFKKSLTVVHVTTGQYLTEGVHFDLGYRFEAASRETATEIYAAIVITDRTLTGQLKVTYQTLGGEWVMDTQEILNIIANIKNDPRNIKWDDLIDKPIVFPPVDHLHNADDMVGMDEVREAIDAITAAVGVSAGKALSSLLEHIRDHANPHHVSLAQLGLDALGSLSEATEADVDAGTDNLRFISARRLIYFMTKRVQPAINAHANRKDNPHTVTKTQVGLSEVANYRMATLAEALEGLLNTRYMSPALVQAIVADRIAAALSGQTNTVTKESIGLGNVPNYAMATLEQALAGTSNEYFMSPLRTAQYSSNAIASAMAAHLAADNPHKITKGTVGLGNVQNYGIATTPELIAGSANDKYVTVAGVTAMIQNSMSNGVGGDLSVHLKDYNNPHKVTKAQVGLSDVQNYGVATAAQVVATVSNKYLTPSAMLGALWARLAERVAANSDEGDVGFVNNNQSTGGFEYGRILNRSLNLAESEAEITLLKNDSAHTSIYSIASQTLIEWVDGAWVSTGDSSDAVLPGRIYHTKATGKTFYAETSTLVYLIAIVNPTISLVTSDSTEIKLTGKGTTAEPLVATLTGKTDKEFNSSVDVSTGS